MSLPLGEIRMSITCARGTVRAVFGDDATAPRRAKTRSIRRDCRGRCRFWQRGCLGLRMSVHGGPIMTMLEELAEVPVRPIGKQHPNPADPALLRDDKSYEPRFLDCLKELNRCI